MWRMVCLKANTIHRTQEWASQAWYNNSMEPEEYTYPEWDSNGDLIEEDDIPEHDEMDDTDEY